LAGYLPVFSATNESEALMQLVKPYGTYGTS